ncbi:MAG: globin family protein [Actinomycetota bacterium]
MTPAQIELVRTSFSSVEPIADAAAELFYSRLFEIAPETRPLFTGDMAAQGRKLMTTLGVVVRGLEGLDDLMPTVVALAERHVGYGVTAAHYEAVGAALLWTLEKGLGDAYTPDVADAWATTYGVLSDAMTTAAYGSATDSQLAS